MIDYGIFHFAAPPRMGSAWIQQAAAFMGLPAKLLPDSKFSVYVPHSPDRPPGPGPLRLSLVRSPDTWLAAYFVLPYARPVGVPEVDWFAGLPRDSFEAFVWGFLDAPPGRVGAMLSAYHADSVLRAEDLPGAFVEAMEALGREDARECVNLRPTFRPAADLPEYPPGLRRRVLDAESEMCERFHYWG